MELGDIHNLIDRYICELSNKKTITVEELIKLKDAIYVIYIRYITNELLFVYTTALIDNDIFNLKHDIKLNIQYTLGTIRHSIDELIENIEK
jgi:hypothetical protein